MADPCMHVNKVYVVLTILCKHAGLDQDIRIAQLNKIIRIIQYA